VEEGKGRSIYLPRLPPLGRKNQDVFPWEKGKETDRSRKTGNCSVKYSSSYPQVRILGGKRGDEEMRKGREVLKSIIHSGKG